MQLPTNQDGVGGGRKGENQQLQHLWRKATEKQKKKKKKKEKEEEGLLLILPSLSPRPPLHRLLPSSFAPSSADCPLFPVRRDAAPRHHLRANAGMKWKWKDQRVQVLSHGN